MKIIFKFICIRDEKLYCYGRLLIIMIMATPPFHLRAYMVILELSVVAIVFFNHIFIYLLFVFFFLLWLQLLFDKGQCKHVCAD